VDAEDAVEHAHRPVPRRRLSPVLPGN
jgi:hypothetical protein